MGGSLATLGSSALLVKGSKASYVNDGERSRVKMGLRLARGHGRTSQEEQMMVPLSKEIVSNISNISKEIVSKEIVHTLGRQSALHTLPAHPPPITAAPGQVLDEKTRWLVAGTQGKLRPPWGTLN